jgi:GDP-L-fucose synthase
MDENSKIYVAGHKGLVGSAIWKRLKSKGYNNLVGRTHGELDLMDISAVREFFKEEQPKYVILAAAYVGGIIANNTYRADFIYRNLQIQNNVITPNEKTISNNLFSIRKVRLSNGIS